jgi:hypothetical protein
VGGLVACTSDAPHAPRDAGPASDASASDVATDSAVFEGDVGGFVDLTRDLVLPFTLAIERSPAGRENHVDESFGVICPDLDGSGEVSVVLGTTRGEALVFRYDAALGLVANPRVRLPAGAGAVLSCFDLDRDGHADLTIARQGLEVAWGLGGGAFEPPRPILPGVSDQRPPGPGVSAPPPTGAHFDDIDGDGWLDVVVAHWACNPSTFVLLRTSPRGFRDGASLVTAGEASRPLAVFAGSMGNGNKLIASMGDPCRWGYLATTFYRSAAVDALGYPSFEPFDVMPPDAYFRLRMDRPEPEASLSLETPMALALGDLNGDSIPDLAITLVRFHEILQGTRSFPFVERAADTGFAEIPADDGRVSLTPWTVAFLDLFSRGRLDVVTTHGVDLRVRESFGPQQVTVHQNVGDFRFADVTARLGAIGRRGQWKAMAVGDLDGDGRPDLVVGGQAEPPRVYLNRIDVGNRALALRLRGTSSDALGLDAQVSVRVGGGAPFYPHGQVASPSVFSEPIVFVGLGASARADEVRVRWPSGTLQVLAGLDAGRTHVVVEPPLFLIEPADRRVPADGTSRATLSITPRNPDGSVRTEADVRVRVAYGAQVPLDLSRVEGRWVATLTAPTAPGSTVLELTIDGAPSAVRPRIWWGPAVP